MDYLAPSYLLLMKGREGLEQPGCYESSPNFLPPPPRHEGGRDGEAGCYGNCPSFLAFLSMYLQGDGGRLITMETASGCHPSEGDRAQSYCHHHHINPQACLGTVSSHLSP